MFSMELLLGNEGMKERDPRINTPKDTIAAIVESPYTYPTD
jgi:hypothetical protein